jgi:polyisoprenoid-binding protein YceI
MKKDFLLIGFFVLVNLSYSQVFIAKSCEITFFSASTVEDITATNKETYPLLNTSNGNVQMKIGMRLFKFSKPLMEEHFNENYVETEKYPYSIFKGKINESIDYTKDGEYYVTVTGILSLHGIDKEKTIPGKLIVKGKQIIISAVFKINLSEHNIVIPSLYTGVIPDETEVKINATLEPFKK